MGLMHRFCLLVKCVNYFIDCCEIARVVVTIKAVRDKISLGEGGDEQNLPEYFFTCPNMTNLVDKFHDNNCIY